MPSVRGVERFGETGVARRNVRRRNGAAQPRGVPDGPGLLARGDGETLDRSNRSDAGADPFDLGEGGRRRSESADETIECFAVALHIDQDAARVVANESLKLEGARQNVDKGPEPDALNHSLDCDHAALEHATPQPVGLSSPSALRRSLAQAYPYRQTRSSQRHFG